MGREWTREIRDGCNCRQQRKVAGVIATAAVLPASHHTTRNAIRLFLLDVHNHIIHHVRSCSISPASSSLIRSTSSHLHSNYYHSPYSSPHLLHLTSIP